MKGRTEIDEFHPQSQQYFGGWRSMIDKWLIIHEIT